MSADVPRSKAVGGLVIEAALTLAVVGSLVHITKFFLSRGFLPQPFVFDANDTFMDWFNTAYWAHNGHAYDIWKTIYTPLSFVFLKLFGTSSCYQNAPYDARDCDVLGIVSVLASYLACAVVAGVAFYRNDRRTALFRTISFGLGLPLLYALERGNLIMVGFVFFALIFGNLVRSTAGIAVCAAIAINFKNYLLFPMFAYAVKRDWRRLEVAGLATIFLYLVTIAIYGSGTPIELANNLQAWFIGVASNIWDQVYYSTSYTPFLAFDNFSYPIRDFVEQRTLDAVKTTIEIVIPLSRGICLLVLLGSWLYPNALTKHRVGFFALMQSFVAQSPGGYGMILMTFLVFLEPWNKEWGTRVAIVCAYVLSIPNDWVLGNFYTYERSVWLSGRIADTAFGLSVGALARPAIILVLVWALAINSLRAIAKEWRKGKPTHGLSPMSLEGSKPAST